MISIPLVFPSASALFAVNLKTWLMVTGDIMCDSKCFI